MSRRRRRFRVLKRWRRTVEMVQAILVLLSLPFLLVLPLALLPFLLLAESAAERRRPCPHCGLRGTLRDITPPIQLEPEEGDFPVLRRRIVRVRRWQCEVCGSEFEQRDGEAPRPVPPSGEAA